VIVHGDRIGLSIQEGVIEESNEGRAELACARRALVVKEVCGLLRAFNHAASVLNYIHVFDVK